MLDSQAERVRRLPRGRHEYLSRGGDPRRARGSRCAGGSKRRVLVGAAVTPSGMTCSRAPCDSAPMLDMVRYERVHRSGEDVESRSTARPRSPKRLGGCSATRPTTTCGTAWSYPAVTCSPCSQRHAPSTPLTAYKMCRRDAATRSLEAGQCPDDAGRAGRHGQRAVSMTARLVETAWPSWRQETAPCYPAGGHPRVQRINVYSPG